MRRLVLIGFAVTLSGCFLDRTVNGSGHPQPGDAALADGGAGMDASSARDAEVDDASVVHDAGAPVDADVPLDAGAPDADVAPDAGSCIPVGDGDDDETCDGVDDDCDGVIDQEADCGCERRVWGGHTYLFCTDGRRRFTVIESESADYWCAGRGYALVTIDDDDENEWLATTADDVRNNETWWTGAYDRGMEDDFRWTDGDPLGFNNWIPGEPNGGIWENCLEIDPNTMGDAGVLGGWNDESCVDSWRPFICEAGPG